MKVKITARLEISDHDGYCSDVSNIYTDETHTYIRDTDTTDTDITDISTVDNEFWIKLLPIIDTYFSGSGYCHPGYESEQHGLGIHDYRYTIISVEAIMD